MAFAAWCEGNFDSETLKFLASQPANRYDVLSGAKIKRRDIPGLLTPEFSTAYGVWSDWKKFGMPYTGGWAQQPAHLMLILRVFENEYAAWKNKKQHPTGGQTLPRGGKGKKR